MLVGVSGESVSGVGRSTAAVCTSPLSCKKKLNNILIIRVAVGDWSEKLQFHHNKSVAGGGGEEETGVIIGQIKSSKVRIFIN